MWVWDMNLGPLLEQQVLAFLAAKPPFQPQSWLIVDVTPLTLGPIKRQASGLVSEGISGEEAEAMGGGPDFKAI